MKIPTINLSRKNTITLALLFFLFFASLIGIILPKIKFSQKNKAAEIKREIPRSRGYIVELKEQSVQQYAKTLKNTDRKLTSQIVQNYKAQLVKQHNSYKNQLVAVSEKRKEDLITAEYFTALNGFAINVTEEQMKELAKNISSIKRYEPNLEVMATLPESVPLIEANKLWQYYDTQDKKVTGEGINVAVIDTGVDYTHPDLGGTHFDERTLQSFSIQDGTTIITDTDQVIGLNNDRLAFPKGNKITLYSFGAKNYTDISLFADNLYVIRLALKNNILAYYADETDGNTKIASLYAQDLNTNKKVKIATTENLGYIQIYGNKIIYGRDNATYVYDMPSETEKIVVSPEYMPKVSGNKIAYSVYDLVACYSKIGIYNLDTDQLSFLEPPHVGPVLDFKGNKILYLGCDKFDYDRLGSTYYVYDLVTQEVTPLNYEGSFLQSGDLLKKSDWGTASWQGKGGIGNDNLFFFNKNIYSPNTIAYDAIKKRYAKINLTVPSQSLESEDNRVCFVASMSTIYCHTYDPNNAYPLPPSIFNSKVVNGFNFIDGTGDPFDDNGHGTHVSSIIGGKGAINGVAPGVKITAYKVLNSDGTGYTSDVLAALDRSVDSLFDGDSTNNIDVMNLSLGRDCKAFYGGYTETCGPDDLLSVALDNAADAGIVPVVSAGNSGGSGSGTIGSPGTSRKAITVGAVDKTKKMATFSSLGPVIWSQEIINKPDLVAPGVGICAAKAAFSNITWSCIDNIHTSLNGTSMAAPHIAGVVALLKQADRGLETQKIKEILTSSSEDLGYDKNTQGAGLVNALRAVVPRLPSQPAPIPPTTVPTRTPTPTPTPTLIPTNTPTPTPSPAPLLINSSFETDSDNDGMPDGWRAKKNITTNDKRGKWPYHSGSYSYKMTPDTQSKRIVQSVAVDGKAGDKLIFEGWSQADSTTIKGSIGIAIKVIGTSGVDKMGVIIPSTAGKWRSRKWEFTPQQDYKEVQMIPFSSSTTSVVRFDDVQVTRLPKGSSLEFTSTPSEMTASELSDF